MPASGAEALAGVALAPGRAAAKALVLDEPLSFWGGVEPVTGRVIEPRHPQAHAVLTARVLVMPAGRGSSSSSSVLAEAIRLATAPAAILLRSPDPILAVGSLAAAELYGRRTPVVVLEEEAYRVLQTGDLVSVEANDKGAIVRIEGRGGPEVASLP